MKDDCKLDGSGCQRAGIDVDRPRCGHLEPAIPPIANV
jgi:hypothetical protein